jgi:hypothetical protein
MYQIKNAPAVCRRYERPGGAGRKITQKHLIFQRQIFHFEAAGCYQLMYRLAMAAKSSLGCPSGCPLALATVARGEAATSDSWLGGGGGRDSVSATMFSSPLMC